MKKVIFALASIAFLAMGMTACQKDEAVMKFKATIERGNSKTSLGAWDNDNSWHPLTWEPGDEIKVWGGQNIGYHCRTQSTGNTAEFEVAEPTEGLRNSNSFKAGYPAQNWTLFGGTPIVDLPSQRTYRGEQNMYHFPMYAESSNTNLAFKNVCGVLNIHLPQIEDKKLIGIDVYASTVIAGKFAVSMDDDGVPHLVQYAGSTELEMQFNEPFSLNENGGRNIYIYLPSSEDLTTTGGFGGLEMVFYATDQSYAVVRVTEGNYVEIKRNQITTLELNTIRFDGQMSEFGNYFSVSPSLKVDISTGNLQYDGSTSTWHFASRANPFYGNRNPEVGTVDLFARSSTDNNYGLFGSTSTLAGDFKDWGSLVTSDRNTPWRTLTHNEWNYLLRYRHNAQKLFSFVTITDLSYADINASFEDIDDYYTPFIYNNYKVCGALILPDGSTPFDINDDTDELSLILEDLNDYLAHGAAFIPLGMGYVMGQMAFGLPYAVYWNSDVRYFEDSEDPSYNYWGQSVNTILWGAWRYHFGEEDFHETSSEYFSYYSVRLMRDAMRKNERGDWEFLDTRFMTTTSAKGKRK